MTSVYIVDRLTGDKTGFQANPGDTPAYFLPEDSSFDLFLNGHSVTCQPDYELKDGDCVYAIHRPDGADPVTIAVAVAVITAIVTVALLPRPEKPNTQGVQRTSPNNQVSGQTNIARTGEGIPDIKGQIQAFPDVIQAPWYRFQGNSQRLLQGFCVGVGTYDIQAAKVGESLFSDLEQADIIFSGNGTPPSDNKYATPAQGTSNVEILAPDEINASVIFFRAFAATNTVKITAHVGGFGGNALFEQILQLASTNAFTVDPSASISQTGSFEYSSFTRAVERINDPSSGSVVNDIVYTFTVTNRTLTDETVYASGVSVYSQLRRSDQDINGWSPWFQCRETNNLLVNIQFPQGIRNASGVIQTIDYEIDVDTGAIVSGEGRGIPGGASVTITEDIVRPSTIDRFRVRRIQNRIPNGADAMFVESAFSLADGSAVVGDGAVTIAHTEYRADRLRDNIASNDEVSMIATRLQHSYNSSTDTITARNSNNRSFADAILDDAVRLFGETRTRQLFDLESLYEVSDGLSSDLRGFNYSFDDINISFGQRIHTICNVARVGAFRDGQIWRFFREEEKPVTQTFDRRNIAGNSESSQSFNLQKPNGNDSIRLSYINPDDNKERHIDRRINTTTKTFESGIGSRPLEIDLAGCRNETQAINRAELEVRRLVYQRRRVMERVLDDGLLVDIGDRVRWACIYDDATTDAEVLEISGTQLRLSERPAFEQGMSYFGHLTDRNGNVHGPYAITQGSNGDFWVDGFDVTKAYVANHAASVPTQLGSRVIIGTDEDLNYYDFTVTAKTPADDGTVQLELIEYNNLMFSED